MVAAHPSVQGIFCLLYTLHAMYLILHQTVLCLTVKIGSGLVSSSCAVAQEEAEEACVQDSSASFLTLTMEGWLCEETLSVTRMPPGGRWPSCEIS